MKRLFSYLVMAAVMFPAVLTTSCDNEDEKVDSNPKEFTVSFDSNGGSAVSSQTIKKGEKITKPDNPTRSGYAFSTWYKNVELTNEWKFNTDVVTADLTLYAKWIVETPVYNIQKEKVYFATVKGYRDEIKMYYYKHTVTQTNPNITVPDSIIKFKEDSINNIIDIDNRYPRPIISIGIDINGVQFENYYAWIMAYTENQKEIPVNSLIALGRDSLLQIFITKIEGFITTFEDNNKILLMIGVNLPYQINNNTWSWWSGISTGPTGNGDLWLDYQQAFKYDKNLQLPEVNIKEYLFVYDRFNGRNFIDNKGNSYTTKVVIKKLTDIENFDVTAKYTDNNTGTIDPIFQFNKLNPVIQLFKGDELIFEGKINKYAEEWDTNGFLLNKTRTNIEFRAETLKNKLYYQIQYFSYYGTYFQIRGLDFTNPDPGEDFSTKYNEIITIVDDNKYGSVRGSRVKFPCVTRLGDTRRQRTAWLYLK